MRGYELGCVGTPWYVYGLAALGLLALGMLVAVAWVAFAEPLVDRIRARRS
jgi:hypothetical protein